MRIFALTSLPILLASMPTRATVLHVCPDGSGDQPTIQAAVDAAQSGDEIELCDGTFTGIDNMDIDVGTKSLTFRSLHGREVTTIFAATWDPVYGEYVPHHGFFVGSAAVRFEGITIERAGAWEGHLADGGAIQCRGGSLVLDRMRVACEYYHAAARGAGIFLESGTLHAQDCDFSQNRATQSGGAIFAEDSQVELVRCHFAGNVACVGGACVHLDNGAIIDCVVEYGGGGGCDDSNPGGNAITVAGGRVLIQRTVVANSHHVEGGAIAIHSGSVVDIDHCLFDACSSAYFAGAALIYGTATIRNTTFRGNMGASYGGTDIAAYGNVLLDHCIFLNTQVPSAPWGNGIEAAGELVVRSCVFAGQTSYGGSRTIDVQAGADLTIENTILAFGGRDGAPQVPIYCSGMPKRIAVRCTDIYGNKGGDWVGCIEPMGGVDGNLSADPLFCNLVGQDLSIQATSPCAPANSGSCGLIGALSVSCGATALHPSSWGSIKALYR